MIQVPAAERCSPRRLGDAADGFKRAAAAPVPLAAVIMVLVVLSVGIPRLPQAAWPIEPADSAAA
jgi:hypothetical protein